MKLYRPLLLFIFYFCYSTYGQDLSDADQVNAGNLHDVRPQSRKVLQINDNVNANIPPPNQQVPLNQQGYQQQQPQQQQPPQQQQEPKIMEKRLKDYEQCQEDIHKHCTKGGLNLESDMAVLECLQDVDVNERETLTQPCENLIWEYKVNLTTESRFSDAARSICAQEISVNTNLSNCLQETRPGYAMSCFLDHLHEMQRTSRCFQFLARAEVLAFSDFNVVGPFVEKCQATVARLSCGYLTPISAHRKAQVAHSQGSTLECLIKAMLAEQKRPGSDDPYGIKLLGEECRHEVMRIAELQTDDFHLDRALYFACRADREKFCRDVPSGAGKVFECLIGKRSDPYMEPECSKMLAERAQLMGQNFRLAHPLVDACGKEMQNYQCTPRPEAKTAQNYHLSWVLLCLENAHHATNGTNFSDECKHEMITHRTMMMNEFRMSPEVVLTCGKEINDYCSPKGDIEGQGKTLHCLMGVAEGRDPKQQLGTECRRSLETIIKLADIGSNYQVDRVLYASCRPLIEGACAKDLESHTSTLTCLMRHVDNPDMPKECEKRLLEVQYFLARDWTLDPEIYQACHADAVERCHAPNEWHLQADKEHRAEEGPLVLSCLYRSAYDEQHPLQPACAENIRRVLHLRAARVFLMPDVEDVCRDALSEFCSANTNPSEEMRCLQQHFQTAEFRAKYQQCYAKLAEFTAMEAKDTALNHALTRACKPVISKYCQEFANEAIDHGDVMECLYNHKDSQEMNKKCRSYVDHFELISLRDYHFSYKFNKSCQGDIQKYCHAEILIGDKPQIIQCLSRVMFEHRVLGAPNKLEPECKKQLKTAFIQQEQFDDKQNMADAHPALMKNCRDEITQHQCVHDGSSFEDVVECLRENYEKLGPACQAAIFTREKIEAADNEFDNELQKTCRHDIERYCHGYDEDKVLTCLMNSKVIRVLSQECQKVVFERMHEQVQDIRLNVPLFDACKSEAEHLCAEDYKKINDVKYEKKMLQGVIIQCLRAKFASGAELSDKCKVEISNVIVESEFDVRLDPPLYHACKTVVADRCKDHVITRGFDVYEVLECLKDEYRKGNVHDKLCGHEIARRLQESLVDIHLDPSLHESCSRDLKQFCDDITPGQSRMIICLMDTMKGSKSGLMSEHCRQKLAERNELWMKLHKEQEMIIPESMADFAYIVNSHPHRISLLAWFAGFVLILFCIGCCCGRASKRIRRELKNR